MKDVRSEIRIFGEPFEDEIFKENEITCKELCELYAKFSKMYIISRKKMYTEEDLKIFEVKHKELTSSAKKVIHRKAKGFGKVFINYNYEKKLKSNSKKRKDRDADIVNFKKTSWNKWNDLAFHWGGHWTNF
ncbi:hypothetical protein C1646_675874 [Rhizophagus diaphanus]|nr:hypothetical protein C1646_675874 [Rhizophagus diaphanus] [Rhizophagus sp. MUCL 43196]